MFMKGLFSVKKGETLLQMTAPVNGTVIPESNIPDEAFSSGMLGHGFGIIPADGEFFSPVNGTVIDVTPTKHAYSIKSNSGAEILIHIGIDTVEMKGDGFTALVSSGDRVKAGDPIARADMKKIRAANLSDAVAVIVINHELFSQMTVFEGKCKAKETTVMSFVASDRKK